MTSTRKNFNLSYTSVKRHTKKRGKKYTVIGYTDNNTGRKIPTQTRKRIESFYIPPAYNNNILVAKSANNKVQVICEDTAGRKQYIYHPRHLAGKERRKYNKLSALAKYAYYIERDTRNYIKSLASHTVSHIPYTKNELVQIVLYMLITYHFRIGCREYEKEYGSTGISTLRPEHFHIQPESTAINIQFKGKKGVENNCVESWQPAITIIQRLCKNHLPAIKSIISGDNIQADPVHIFSYLYTNPISEKQGISVITSQDVVCYLVSKYGDDAIISPKMFRTWYANYHLLDYLRSKPPTDPKIKICMWIGKELGKNEPVSEKQQVIFLKREIPKYVSKHLNNTPSVCKSDYINNRLLQNVLLRPEYYRKQALSTKTDKARHQLVAKVLTNK